MASKNNNTEQGSKADVILQREEEIMRQQSELKQKVDQLINQPNGKEEIMQKISREFAYSSKQSSQIYEGLKAEIAGQKKEFSYMSTQVESAYQKLSAEITRTVDDVSGKVAEEVARQYSELTDDMMAKVSAELAYMSAQITSVFDKLDKKFDTRIAALEEKVDGLPKAVADEIEARAQAAAEEGVEEAVEEESIQTEGEAIDYEELSKLVAEKLEEILKSPELDYDALAQNVADRIPPQEVVSEEHIASRVVELANLPECAAVDYEELSDLIVEKLNEKEQPAEEIAEELEEVPAEETEEVAEVAEVAEAEAIAVETAEDVEEAEEIREIDYELLADEIAKRIIVPAPEAEAAEIDYDLIAEKIVAKLPVPAEEHPLDTEALADDIAHKVDALTNNEFAIVVDDEGCKTLAGAVAQDIDYDMLADKIAEKIAAADQPSEPALNSEDLAAMIADRIPVVDEDVIADKTAAAVSNYIPNLDVEEIAEKVVSLIIPELPAAPEPAEVNYDELCNRLTVIITEAQAQLDYDIVLDGEGIHMLADAIVEELSVANLAGFDGVNAKLDTVSGMIDEQSAARDSKFDDVHAKLDSIIYKEDEASQKAEALYIEADAAKKGVQSVKEDTTQIISMLGEGALVVVKTEEDAEDETAIADAQLAEEPAEEIVAEEPVEEVVDEPAEEPVEEVAEEPAEEPVEEVAEEPAEEPVEEAVEEPTEEPVEEVIEEPAEEPVEEVIEESVEEPVEEQYEDDDLVTVSDIVDDEILEGDDSIAELIEDEEAEGKGGVDFANMMKYNRSFIARIIQGSDDVKRYYGQIKNAMLSYKKVNSSIAWGAERFNKGRETIAKLKIRGKTLCLYLNLNPNDYKVSVYHQVDVTDNKSMSGTPMMVKIKSPLGVRKAIRLIDEMLAKRNGEKRVIEERDYASMYPYETIEELIEDGLVKDVRKNK